MSSSAEVLKPCSETPSGASPCTSSLPGPVPVAKPAWGGAGVASPSSGGSCPWGSASSPISPDLNSSSTSFRDLMSEDLAKDIQDKENDMYMKDLLKDEGDESSLLELNKSQETDDDLILAQMLQYEFDREYDQQVNREEKHYNGNSKVSVSFNKFKICPSWYGPDSDDELHELDEDNRDFDSFEARERCEPVMPACGYVKVGNNFVTKHDPKIAGRKNAERIMNLPPGINTGDGGSFDMHLSNKVFNKLQRSAMSEVRRKNRVHDKVEKATTDMALDPNTRLLIFKLVNNAVLESVGGTISSGKEAVVFHALGGEFNDEPLPEECAVKVFKTTLTDFKTREKYMREDYRFKDRLSKNNTQKTIHAWAEKEYHNLRRLQRAGIPSPKPILIKKHVLLMSFIGKDNAAAPKLKEANLSFANLCLAYDQVVEAMVTMYQGCRLVHADMSEYNILWFKDTCYIIDVGQAVEPTHPHGLQFLYRDCTNIIKYFTSKRLPDLLTPLQLFEKITNIKLPGDEENAIAMIEEYENQQELLREGMENISDQFEHLWQEIQSEERRKSAHVSDDVDSDEENDNLEDDLEHEVVARGSSSVQNPKSKKKNNKGRSADGDGGGTSCPENDSSILKEKDSSITHNDSKSSTVRFSDTKDYSNEEFPSLGHQTTKNDLKQPKKNKKKKK